MLGLPGCNVLAVGIKEATFATVREDPHLTPGFFQRWSIAITPAARLRNTATKKGTAPLRLPLVRAASPHQSSSHATFQSPKGGSDLPLSKWPITMSNKSYYTYYITQAS